MHQLVHFLVVGALLVGLSACGPASSSSHEKSGTWPELLTRIAFGSCSHQDDSLQMWDEILAQHPQLWIWGGDNIYGDSHDMAVLHAKYQQQKMNPQYRALMKACRITGTWDDHDYGVNDGGRFFSKRQESKALLLSFLEVPAYDEVRTHAGVYSAYTYGEGAHQVKVINLDTRTFRDTVYKEDVPEGWRYVPNKDGDILGEAQWAWLKNQLEDSTVAVHLINSSIQVVSEEHRFEKWANFPQARKRLLDLIASSKAQGVVILSGDRHMAELSKISWPGMAYPLYDFTASGLTHTWDGPHPEANRHRVAGMAVAKNFGLITIDWSAKTPVLTLAARGHEGAVFFTETVRF